MKVVYLNYGQFISDSLMLEQCVGCWPCWLMLSAVLFFQRSGSVDPVFSNLFLQFFGRLGSFNGSERGVGGGRSRVELRFLSKIEGTTPGNFVLWGVLRKSSGLKCWEHTLVWCVIEKYGQTSIRMAWGHSFHMFLLSLQGQKRKH